MTNVLTIPMAKSEILNAMLTVITLPNATAEIVVAASELIAIDATLDGWFLREIKPQAAGERLEEVLDVSDAVAERCKVECARFVGGAVSHTELVSVLRSAKADLEALRCATP